MSIFSTLFSSDSIIWALIENASLLIALAYVHSLLPVTKRRMTVLGQLGLGILLGLIGVTLITTAYPFRPGIIFDTRSILISIAGLYFGFIPTFALMMITAAFRFWQGGAAAPIGVSVILASGLIGLAWRYFRKPDLARIRWHELFAFGYTVHAAMLAIFLAFPAEDAAAVFAIITIPVLGIYPPVTAVLGKILSSRLRRVTDAERLRESEERFKLIFKGANDGWWDWNRLSNQITYSPRWWEMLGMVPDELEATPNLWRELLHPDDAERVDTSFQKVLKSGEEQYEVEFRLRHCSGHYISVISRGHVQRDKEGAAVRISGTNVDITERKTLEKRVREAEKMESIGRLAGGIAHDFNNMLGVIIGHTDLANHRIKTGESIHGDLAQIRDAADRSADLVRQLLTFARRQVTVPKVIDLNQSIDSTLAMLRRLIGGHIELNWQPDGSPCRVKIDPVQMDQILTNLVLNARDAIGGHGVISIRTRHSSGNPESDKAGRVTLEVHDTGSGMDAETLKHVFEPFFTTKPLGQGTGLGLATVYGIVEQNGGAIEVISEPGNGATFLIDFPGQAGLDAVTSIEPKRSDPAGNETILLVEDEPAILFLATQTLKIRGYTVLPAASPVEALEITALEDQTIDLVVSDMIMPEMNGVVLRTRILAQRPGLKFLFVSGHTDGLEANLANETGVAFLAKPFSGDLLAEKIRAMIDA